MPAVSRNWVWALADVVMKIAMGSRNENPASLSSLFFPHGPWHEPNIKLSQRTTENTIVKFHVNNVNLTTALNSVPKSHESGGVEGVGGGDLAEAQPVVHGQGPPSGGRLKVEEIRDIFL